MNNKLLQRMKSGMKISEFTDDLLDELVPGYGIDDDISNSERSGAASYSTLNIPGLLKPLSVKYDDDTIGILIKDMVPNCNRVIIKSDKFMIEMLSRSEQNWLIGTSPIDRDGNKIWANSVLNTSSIDNIWIDDVIEDDDDIDMGALKKMYGSESMSDIASDMRSTYNVDESEVAELLLVSEAISGMTKNPKLVELCNQVVDVQNNIVNKYITTRPSGTILEYTMSMIKNLWYMSFSVDSASMIISRKMHSDDEFTVEFTNSMIDEAFISDHDSISSVPIDTL